MNPAALAQTGELAESLAAPDPPPLRTGRVKTLVMEHKTSSEDIGLGSMYWRKLTLDDQVSGYHVGARALGYEPDGVLYDVLRKPALRPYEANSKRIEPESPAAYRDRILADIGARPDYYYQRGIVVRLEQEERDAAFDVWQTAEQIRLARNAERWPRNVDACSMYNRLCEYWAACSGESSIDDRTLFEKTDHPHVELDLRHHLPLITSSSSRKFRACPRRYYFGYELGMRSRKEAATLHMGKRIHRALEAWLKGGMDLDAAIDALALAPYDHDAAKAEAMIRGYHARWSSEPLEVLAVEAEFVAPLINPETGSKSRTFLRAGKIDAIVRRHE